jgi:hypothetical protein
MSRTCIPFSTGDISALTRSIHAQLAGLNRTPGHLELLNILARAAGYRNFQSLRAQAKAREQLETQQPPPAAVDFAQVVRVSRHFDARGRLATWPARTSLQVPCLWVLWSRLPSAEPITEDRLNRELRSNHTFGDHALLRRELCDANLLTRTANGREYRRVERRPPAEALELIRHLERRPR